MYIMIDNYDSFVYNLAVYFEELGESIKLIRNDAVTLADLEALYAAGELSGIIISPGPKTPEDCGLSAQIVKRMAGRVPILGVCLGHQIIGHVFGAQVTKGAFPAHGKVTTIHHLAQGLFKDLPTTYAVTRYHSLVVSSQNLPDCLVVDALTEDQTIMALHHADFPIYGVQFHPEAVLTEHGHALLQNYLNLSQKWWRTHENTNYKTA